MKVPFGTWMEMGWVASRLLMTGVATEKKLAVQPVSAMPMLGAGGPVDELL